MTRAIGDNKNKTGPTYSSGRALLTGTHLSQQIDLMDLEPLGSTSREEDPDAFHEGDAFTVQQEEEDDEWEECVDWDSL